MKLSETEQEQERKVANNDVIRHFERRTIAMCHSRFVAVSRCSILTPAGPTNGQLGEA